MNFYNPYMYGIPAAASKVGLLSRLNLGSIISGTSKTLNFINQTIPVVKQISPIVKNAKTMFKVMNEFKKVEIPVTNTTNSKNNTNNRQEETREYVSQDGPQFFI